MLTVAALLAAVALSVLATWLVSIRTNPRPNHVHSLGVIARLVEQNGHSRTRDGRAILRYGGPRSGLRVDMLVHVHPTLFSCGEARVDLVISGTRRFWREQDDRLAKGVTRVALGWDTETELAAPETASDGKRPFLAALNPDPQSPLHPSFYLDSDKELQRAPRTRPYFEENADNRLVGVAADVPDWRVAAGEEGYRRALHFRFTTKSWLERRAFGSCYVSLPTLPANGAVAGQASAAKTLYGGERDFRQRAFDALRSAQPPVIGRTVLDVDGELSLGDTSPAPSNFESVLFAQGGSPTERVNDSIYARRSRAGPVWTCRPTQDLSYLPRQASRPSWRTVPPEGSYAGDACGAIAVVAAPRADDLRGFAVLVLGILIGFFFDSFRRGVAHFWRTTVASTRRDTPTRGPGP